MPNSICNNLTMSGRRVQNILMNNNLKVPRAASRLAQLPVVKSVCATLSVLYTDTKCYNPNLKSVCEALERKVSALSTLASTTVSPVIIRFEPQISIANAVACKTLDWLETSFPVLLSPTDEVAASAKNKMHEIQDVVSIVARGTVDCVQHTVVWLTSRMLPADGANQSVVVRTVDVASVGLDSALSLLEGLMDQVLPPIEEDKDEAHLVEGFEVATHRRRYPKRIISIGTKLCRRTCYLVGSKIQTVKVRNGSSRSTPLVQDLQTTCLSLVYSIQGLPQYLQHQVVATFFFINQMYALSCQPRQELTQRTSCLSNAAESSSPYRELVYPLTAPALRVRPTRTFVFDTGCNEKRCVRR